MKIFKKKVLQEIRKNTHQTHLEDLVLLGREGFNELNDKIDKFEKTLEGQDVGLNTTTKIDGAPAVVCWHKFEGYPDDSICLKSFTNGPEKAKVMSSVEDIKEKYGDNPKMVEMLTNCLEIAKHIPSGQAWQGDCLFTGSTKSEREINGKNYITFLPNTILYAFGEDNPGYNDIKNADFGIAFHTIYSGDPYNPSQSFRVDASKLNLPSNIYSLSPVLHASTNKQDYSLDEISSLQDQLKEVESKLVNDLDYNELITNKEFNTFWGTFENKNFADNKLYHINVDTFIDDLKNHLESRAPKMSKVGAERIRKIVEEKSNTLVNIVKALNIASDIKMALWKGFNSTARFDYDSFYHNEETDEYIPTSMEGIAMSDSDGNIVKIVDRPTFASNNRNMAFAKGFKHESLDEELGKTAVIAFGRMNPPTIGHQKLVDKMASLAQGEKAKLYLSHTQDKKKNPLDYDTKIEFAKKAFEPKVDVVKTDDKTVIDILHHLYEEGYTDIIYVGGSDRIGGSEDISSLILRYNGNPDRKGNILYNFNSINFESAGERNEESDDISEKASASLAREYVKQDDFDSFNNIIPLSEEDSFKLFNKIKEGLELKENLLTEATLSGADLSKHDYKYFDGVVNDLLNGDGVILKDKFGTKVTLNKKYPELYSELMEIKNLENSREQIKRFNELTGLEWTKIWKGPYSGQTVGQSAGERAEPVVAYLYNHLGEDIDIDLGVNEKWLKSSEIIANFINDYWPSGEYIAVHVNGNDLENVGEYSKVGKLFKSKSDAENVLGLNKGTLNALYSRQKDNWNKADILLIKRGSDVISELKNRSITNANDYNELLKLFSMKNSNQLLVPISLKGVGEKDNPTLIPEGFTKDELVKAQKVYFAFPQKPLVSNDNNCSCFLIDDLDRKIQFRRQADTEDSLSIEVSLNKNARGGKGISKLKNELGLTGNSWYENRFNSEDELINQLREHFNLLNNPTDKFINGYTSGKYEWFNRTCFRGIINLINNYLEKIGGNSNTFFDWIYESSSGGSGAWYLIH